MIIPWSRINDYDDPFGGKLFGGGKILENPYHDWRSRIPNVAALSETALADPAFESQYKGFTEAAFGSSKTSTLQQFIGELAMADWIDGVRQTIGQVVQATGIVSTGFGSIDTIFKSSSSDVLKGFEVAGMVLESKVFEMAMNSIGAVPVVGWIIKAVYEIANVTARLVMAIRDSGGAAARESIARQLTIPSRAIQFNTDADEGTAKAFFGMIQDGNAQSIIRPVYRMPVGASNLGFEAAGVRKKEGDDLASGWVVSGQDHTGGLGFVPGTSSLTRSLFFPAGVSSAPGSSSKGCEAGALRDMATLYPTAQNLCTSWWSQVNSPGPSMYSVRPLAAKAEWENYMERMFALAENVMKGWTCAPSGIVFTNKFKCIKNDMVGMGSCKKTTKDGKVLTIPGDFGRGSHLSLYGYLCRLYFGIDRPFNMDKGGLSQLPRVGNQSYLDDLNRKYYRADALDMSKSVPISSLDVLYANQRATLNSLQCMYVDGNDTDRFPAFKDQNLYNLWRQSVTDVFASDSWRRVCYQDMPDGEAKAAFRDYAQSKGIQDVENFNRPCRPDEKPRQGGCGPQMSGMKLAAHHQIPDDPALPQKPQINGAVMKMQLASGIGGKSSKKKSSSLPLILAGGALAYLFVKGRK